MLSRIKHKNETKKLEEVQQLWHRLHRDRQTLGESNRFGMLSPDRTNANGRGIYRCLACRMTFDNVTAARTHNCPLEDEFREYTGRKLGVVKMAESQLGTPNTWQLLTRMVEATEANGYMLVAIDEKLGILNSLLMEEAKCLKRDGMQ